jgi:drug/metabolite transporter (DMT)-like permease
MFLGMALAMPLYWLFQWWDRNKPSSDEKPAKQSENEITWATLFSLAIPACFDLAGTALAGVGLLYTTVSVYQLVRCTVIIVTAILRYTVLKHRVATYAWFGLFLNTLAMLLVSSTSFIQIGQDDSINGDPRMGIFFILLSCVVQGAQYVFEERVMSFNNAPPLVVVGMEGVWGSLIMPILIFPAAYWLPGSDNGRIEDSYDSVIQICNNHTLRMLLLAFCAIVFFYNVFCIYVTFLLDSIWHAILDNFRPVSVWTVDLLIYYAFTDGSYGESWGVWSWFELAGMILLFYGTAVYNGSVRLGCFDYTEYEEDLDADVKTLPPFPSAPALSSPYIPHTPRKFKGGTPLLGPTPQKPRQTAGPSSRRPQTPDRFQSLTSSGFQGSRNTHYGSMD